MGITAEITNHISSCKEKYSKASAKIHIWASINVVHPTISNLAIEQLIPFATTL